MYSCHRFLCVLVSRVLPVVLLCALLSACAEQMIQQRDQALQGAFLDCTDRYKRGEFKTYRESAACKNNAETSLLGSSIGNSADLLAQEEAYRLVLASKLDAKQITEAEANLQMAQYRSGLLAEQQRRSNEAQAADAARIAAAASLMRSMPQPYQLPMPQPYQMPVRQTTNCFGTGNTVNCQTY
ncbi:MAG: hypothetical protein ACREC0_10895 [Methylocella sp.]